MTTLTYDRGLWQAHNAYAHRAALKAAGWRWDAPYKRWATADLRAVQAFAEAFPGLLGPEALRLLNEQQRRSDDRLEASAATSADIALPVPPGRDLMPFQKAGVASLVEMPRALLADEMGLGKTVQAITLANALYAEEKFEIGAPPYILVIAPAGLLLNWQTEIERWSLVPAEHWRLVSWSKLAKSDDVLAHPWYLTIVDEAHYAKDRGSQRTKALSQVVTRRAVALTGTPILNRPVELFPLLSWLAPARWGTFWSFAKRYCDARPGRYGWDFSGASNIEELDDRLRRSIMVRRLKSQVLTELPPKVRQVIPLSMTAEQTKVVREEQTAFDAWQVAKGEGKKGKLMMSLAQLATARQKVALAKVPQVVAHVTDILDAGEGPVVLFAHHHSVIECLRDTFRGYSVATYDGRNTARQRDMLVKGFQDGMFDVLIAGIQAAGVGITLTRASVAVFAELDWVPANMAQAEDRLHRIGQAGSVLVQYLVYDGSVDNRVGAALAYKQQTLDAFDGWVTP